MLFRRKSNINLLPDGRKYRMGLLFAAAMLLGLGLACTNPIIAGLYSEFLTGLGMLYLVFCGGNVGNKWIVGKKGGLLAQIGSPPPPPKDT